MTVASKFLNELTSFDKTSDPGFGLRFVSARPRGRRLCICEFGPPRRTHGMAVFFVLPRQAQLTVTWKPAISERRLPSARLVRP